MMRKGVKYDKGKTRWDLVPWEEIQEAADLWEAGAKKYEIDNWKKGISYRRIFSALVRHLIRWWLCGEEFDPETGAHHLIAVWWNALVLRYYTKHRRKFDDRPKRLKYEGEPYRTKL